MRRARFVGLLAAVSLLAAGAGASAVDRATVRRGVPSPTKPPVPSEAARRLAELSPKRSVDSCDRAPTGFARCHAKFASDAYGRVITTTSPVGYTPVDLQVAYHLPSPSGGALNRLGSMHTVAVITAYDSPNVEADLAVYRATFGLPPCVTATGCFKKVNQNGLQGEYPPPNQAWASEAALDVQMVSAICPACNIVLVEANSNRLTDLAEALQVAIEYGATEISNSYGSEEWAGQVALEGAFTRSYIPITASTGDDGYGVQYPASSMGVTAVGGTTLRLDPGSTRGWRETAWSMAGSGCSAYIPKPGWQTDTGCARRTVADVAVVADPDTGVAVYDSYGNGGWVVAGGTSVGAPIIAAIFALNGTASSFVFPAGATWLNTTYFYDVDEGANAVGCRHYLCRAERGYDGPTGLGTPNGVGAFGGPVTATP